MYKTSLPNLRVFLRSLELEIYDPPLKMAYYNRYMRMNMDEIPARDELSELPSTLKGGGFVYWVAHSISHFYDS